MRAGRHRVALEQQRAVAARMRVLEGRELDPPPRLDVPLMWPVVALVPTAPNPAPGATVRETLTVAPVNSEEDDRDQDV